MFAALTVAFQRSPPTEAGSLETRSLETIASELEPLAALAFALGFLHDANKAQPSSPRDLAAVTPQAFAELARNYGVDAYLHSFGWQATQHPAFGALLRQLALASEASQNTESLHAAAAAWCTAGTPPASRITPETVVHVAARCVRWADRLDGAWLKDGAEALIEHLEKLRHTTTPAAAEALGEWTTVTLADSHLPFLLDSLLLTLEQVCSEQTGLPPLVATHMDGRLVAVLPAAAAERVFASAIDRTLADLPFALSPKLNSRKGLAIVGDRPTWGKLVTHWKNVPQREDGSPADPREAQAFLEVHQDALTPAVWAVLTELWNGDYASRALGQHLVVAPPTGPLAGKYVPLVPRDRLETLFAGVRDEWDDKNTTCAVWEKVWSPLLSLVCILALPTEKGNREHGVPPTAEQRQARIRSAVEAAGVEVPALPWDHPDGFTRAVLTAFWAVGAALAAEQSQHPALRLETVWRVGRALMDGDPASATVGLAPFFPPAWQDGAKEDLRRRWTALASGRSVQSAISNDAGTHRCLFLDEPLPASTDAIGTEFGLYGVKATAFSGRSGRADNLMGAPSSGDNYVSGPARLEHALRYEAFRRQRGKSGGVPITVCAPTRQGLFARIRLASGLEDSACQPQDVASFDLLRQERKPGARVLTAETIALDQFLPRGNGIRLGRFEDFPPRLADQVDFLIRWVDTASRFGRPVHLFRGLPRPEKSFFFFDALPSVLATWLGGRSWRLEEMPAVADRLRLAQWVINRKEGGPGETWLHRLISPETSWAAAAWMLSLKNPDDPTSHAVPYRLIPLLSSIVEFAVNTHSEATLMQDLADANTAFQKFQGGFRNLSNADSQRAWNIAYDAWERHQAENLGSAVSLVDFIAGNLRAELGRKGSLVSNPEGRVTANASEAVDRFAEIFARFAPSFLRSCELRRPMTGAYVYCLEKADQRHWERRRASGEVPQNGEAEEK